MRRPMHVPDVPVDDVSATCLASCHIGVAEILARRDHPRMVDRACSSGEVITREVVRSSSGVPRQRPIEHFGFQCADGNALCIDGIEAAHRITDDQIAFREVLHPLVVTTQARWKAMHDEVRHRFPALQTRWRSGAESSCACARKPRSSGGGDGRDNLPTSRSSVRPRSETEFPGVCDAAASVE